MKTGTVTAIIEQFLREYLRYSRANLGPSCVASFIRQLEAQPIADIAYWLRDAGVSSEDASRGMTLYVYLPAHALDNLSLLTLPTLDPP
jgi:hypothetical protein